MQQADVGILGGGLSGLMAAGELKRRRKSYIVLEKESEPGGLARTVRFGTQRGDTGPHALYSRNPKTIAFFKRLPVRYREHARKVRVVHHGLAGGVYGINYPFENGIGDLPQPERVQCLLGYLDAAAKNPKAFANLDDWIRRGLGEGIAETFMRPYNRKIWNAPLADISMALVRNKIEPAPVRTVIAAAMGQSSVGRRVQSVFLYPQGGIGKVVQALANRVAKNIVTEAPVRAMRREKGRWVVTTARGDYSFKKIISTIPLKDLLGMQPDKKLRALRGKLRHNDTLFVSVPLKKGKRFAAFSDCHWLFFAGPELFYRATMMHAFHRAPQQCVVEITWKGAVKKMTPQAIRRRVLQDLLKAGILHRMSDAAKLEMRRVPFTYPIPTMGLEQVKARIERDLGRQSVRILGRSGRWDYINMDQVVESVWRFFGSR
jgi:protoporphyrinogen oxidase